MNSGLSAICVMVLWCGMTPQAQAQRVSVDAALHTSDKPYIQATGEATVSAKPDQALIEIGVVTRAATAEAAVEQNAKQADAVLADLRKLLGSGQQLKTTSYSVGPNYEYPKPGAPLTIKGYKATNVVEVTLDDLAQVGKIIDAAAKSGANNIQRLEFRLKNSQPVRAQALREATMQAKSSVEAIASGLGLRVLRVLWAQEGTTSLEDFGAKKKSPPPIPPGAVPTPVEAGTIDIDATVTLRVEIGQ